MASPKRSEPEKTSPKAGKPGGAVPQKRERRPLDPAERKRLMEKAAGALPNKEPVPQSEQDDLWWNER